MITIEKELSHEAMLETDRAEAREDLFDARASWLSDHGVRSTDVLTDDAGDEYILSVSDGEFGDHYQVDGYSIYLPKHLQMNEINFPF